MPIKYITTTTYRASSLIAHFCLIGALFFSVFQPQKVHAATETFSTGSFIINMGVTPQTVNNGLRPYGLVYELLNTHNVPIYWVINSSKGKDGIDFSHNAINYRGSAFIVPAEYRTPAVNATITTWTGLGVVGATTVSPITLEVHTILTAAPNWTLDKDNGAIARDWLQAAGIPAAAYGGNAASGWKNPADLACCDDIFVMPHADPVWATHGNLLGWNLNCKGAIWAGCHAVSALELMFNPGNPSQQTNFLSNKTGTAAGGGPYANPANSLVKWNNPKHDAPPPVQQCVSD